VTGPLPKDAVQSALNDLTKKLNDNYPLGIHADSVEVTDSGVVGKFSSQNASIPKADANPCFARLAISAVRERASGDHLDVQRQDDPLLVIFEADGVDV